LGSVASERPPSETGVLERGVATNSIPEQSTGPTLSDSPTTSHHEKNREFQPKGAETHGQGSLDHVYPVAVPGMRSAASPISLAAGLICIITGVAASVAALTSGLSNSWQIAGVALASLCLITLTISSVALRKSGAVDTVAVVMVLAAAYLISGAGWYALASENRSLSPFAAASPLLAVGCIMVCFYGVSRKTLPLLGVDQAIFHGGLTPTDTFSLLGARERDSDRVRTTEKGSEVHLDPRMVAPADIEIVSGCITVDEYKLAGVAKTRVLEEGDILFGGSLILGGEAKGRALAATNDSCLSILESLIAKRLSFAAHIEREEESTARRSTLLALIFCSVAAAISFSERSPDPTAILLAGGGVLLCALFAILRDALLINRLQFLTAWAKRGLIVPSLGRLDDLTRCREVTFEYPLVSRFSAPVAKELVILDDRVGAKELSASLLSLVGRAETELFKSVAQLFRKQASDFSPQRVLDLREVESLGMTGTVHGVSFSIGTEEYLVDRGIHFQPEDAHLSDESALGTLYITVGSDVVAVVLLAEGALTALEREKNINSWPADISARVYTGAPQSSGIPNLVVRASVPAAIPTTKDRAAHSSSDGGSTMKPGELVEKSSNQSTLLEALPMPESTIAIHKGAITLLGAGVEEFGVLIPTAREHLSRVERTSRVLQVVCILGVVSVFVGILVPVLAAIAFPLTLGLTRQLPHR